ncbi:hypothetical protein TRFO_32366 [Tritrichomonas foetus]|uniref:Uncharacterized protein n=1 Tax=Tritrichomonas foetus TaxID=1144522 RepID=A0A1J4JTM9_9EUKA|nr:hypothetical protein TRFO_32366 [Tritrichomonas foetus]|eukprot:OHT00852.1 hypothetical protein TRFO_32366 [Tritrichomonas foetus]
MLENEKKSSYKRKYSEETLSFSKILRDTSPKCYNILRQVLKFPSAQTIEKYFGNEHQFFKSVLINYQLIPAIMEKYKEVFHISQELNAVLSVDAAGLDRPDNGNTYVFVFYLQPLNYEYKCIPLYLFPKSNGSANEEIIQIIYQIVEILKSCSINILAVATDGDPGYNQEAKKNFRNF